MFYLQATNKNLVVQAEELVKDRTNQAEEFAKKLEEKLLKITAAAKPSEFEIAISGSLSELKTDVKEILTKGVKSTSSSVTSGGLSETDRTFLKELTNDTRDAIQDMRLEVLTASDKSKIRLLINLTLIYQKNFFKVSQKLQHASKNLTRQLKKLRKLFLNSQQ